MALQVPRNEYVITQDARLKIALRCETVTKAINKEFWNGSTDLSHSFYVGSYGRHTAIDTSDVDILIKLPKREYDRYDSVKGNGQSRLLQGVKDAIKSTYSTSDIHADGQVVVISFSDGVKFELLPAFEDLDYLGNGKGTYTYPDTNMGGNWRSTNPKDEIKAMAEKNDSSNGLFYDTCKHMRYIRDQYSSYHLSGIVIDTFVYNSIGNWRWPSIGEIGASAGSYENALLSAYNRDTFNGIISPSYMVPGSFMQLKLSDKDTETLGKVLGKMVE